MYGGDVYALVSVGSSLQSRYCTSIFISLVVFLIRHLHYTITSTVTGLSSGVPQYFESGYA